MLDKAPAECSLAEFLQACLQFPVVVFSLLLGLVLIYWGAVLIGAVDLDAIDIGIDTDLDVDVDVDGAEAGVFADILTRLDLTDVPLTVSLSIFTLLAWLLSFVSVQTVGPDATGLVPGSVVAVVASAIAVFITSRFGQVLKPMFRTHYAPSRRSFIGQVCEVTTLHVDDKYGQAEVEDGGAGLIIQVRSSSAEQLGKGSEALIYEYDAENEIFHVKPMPASDSK